MRILSVLFALGLLIGVASAAEPRPFPTNAPARVELRDQYDALQTLAFPATNIIVLTIADKGGSGQIGGWVTLLKSRYAERVEIRGLADVGGVPGFLQGKIRRKFLEANKYPVMLDWSGKVCAQFGYEKGVANILILSRDGRILGRSTGPATEPACADLKIILDKALAAETKP